MLQVVLGAYIREVYSRKMANSAEAFRLGQIIWISPKSKPNNGSWYIHKHSGIFGIIIAHYHKITGLFVNVQNHMRLEPSKSTQKTGTPELCPGEV